MKEPYTECPRFDRCSVNCCPLDPEPKSFHPMDKERVCMMEKQVRIRISGRHPNVLPMGGLTGREYAARKRYDALPLAVKVEMARKGKERLEAHRKDKAGI